MVLSSEVKDALEVDLKVHPLHPLRLFIGSVLSGGATLYFLASRQKFHAFEHQGDKTWDISASGHSAHSDLGKSW